MKTAADTTEVKAEEKEVVNVVDEFDYSTQNETYNERFRSWRKNKNNPYGFRFRKNNRETVFIDGRGFVNNSREAMEQELMTRIFYVIGIAVLMWVVIENVLGKFGISALGVLGVNINTDFFSSVVYGGGAEIVAALIFVSLMKLLIPAYYIHKKLALPGRVEFMSRMNDPVELIGAIGLSLLVCSAVCLPEAYSSDTHEIYAYFSSLYADVAVWDQTEFIIYTLFDLAVVSVLMEMFFHGAMFAALRQFGDPFALLMTALTAALLTQDISEMPAVLLISLTAGYGMLRSGSLFTAIFVQIVYKMYLLALAILEVDTSDNMVLTRNLFMLAAAVTGAICLLIVILSKKRRGKLKLAIYRSETNSAQRFFTAVKTFPYSVVMGLCLLYAIVRAVI